MDELYFNLNLSDIPNIDDNDMAKFLTGKILVTKDVDLYLDDKNKNMYNKYLFNSCAGSIFFVKSSKIKNGNLHLECKKLIFLEYGFLTFHKTINEYAINKYFFMKKYKIGLYPQFYRAIKLFNEHTKKKYDNTFEAANRYLQIK